MFRYFGHSVRKCSSVSVTPSMQCEQSLSSRESQVCLHKLAQGTLTYAQLLVFEGFVWYVLESLVLRCFQNLMALVWMFRRRGYWPNSALHPLFGVFLWTLSILLQKSKCRVSIGCFSNLRTDIF